MQLVLIFFESSLPFVCLSRLILSPLGLKQENSQKVFTHGSTAELGTVATLAHGNSTAEALKKMGIVVTFFLCLVFVIWPLMLRMVRRIPEGRLLKNTYILLFFGTILLSRVDDIFLITGPFALGLFVPSGPPRDSALIENGVCLHDAQKCCYCIFPCCDCQRNY